MIPYLEWNKDENSEVPTLEELNRLIGQLETEGRTSRAFTVTVRVNDETGMTMVVGRQESHITFYDANARPPVRGCTGPWDDDQLIVYSYRGHYSEIPRRFCVPIADAREAMRIYFRTGQRPENLSWNEW
ncbi:MAG: Imm1 family immunity protein [Anaerolineae bacterium]